MENMVDKGDSQESCADDRLGGEEHMAVVEEVKSALKEEPGTEKETGPQDLHSRLDKAATGDTAPAPKAATKKNKQPEVGYGINLNLFKDKIDDEIIRTKLKDDFGVTCIKSISWLQLIDTQWACQVVLNDMTEKKIRHLVRDWNRKKTYVGDEIIKGHFYKTTACLVKDGMLFKKSKSVRAERRREIRNYLLNY